MRPKITEGRIRDIVAESIKQITDGSEKSLTGTTDVSGYQVKKDLDNLVSIVDRLAEKYSDLYDETGDDLYDRFCDRLYSVSENLGRFLKGEGYDSFMRRSPEV